MIDDGSIGLCASPIKCMIIEQDGKRQGKRFNIIHVGQNYTKKKIPQYNSNKFTWLRGQMVTVYK